MDDETTIKLPALKVPGTTSTSDEDNGTRAWARTLSSAPTLEGPRPTIKLDDVQDAAEKVEPGQAAPVNAEISSAIGQNLLEQIEQAQSKSTRPLPVEKDGEVQPLEYEQTWDDKAIPRPLELAAPDFMGLVSKKPRKRFSTRVRVVLTILLLLFLTSGGVLAYGYYYFDTTIQKPLSKIIHPVSRSKDELSNKALSTPIPDDSSITGHNWNILLLGSDNDGKYTFPAVLTQVMMVVHVDTQHNTVTMLSIPRDSWVNVPEIGGMHKIDQAFFLGVTQNNSFDNGVRIARLTIEKDYGISIDRYAWVGLSGFASVIDTLGGIDIDISHPIVDDAYPDDTGANPGDPYAVKRLYLPPGPQHLNGLQALEYVRSRHADLVGDIGRTQRQQQVLQALKLKLNVSSVLSNLPQLIADLNGKVYTDFSEQELISFANFGRSLPQNAIQRITLGPGQGDQDYGDFDTIYDPSVGADQDIVVPHCENIQPVVNRIFGLGNTQSCNVNG